MERNKLILAITEKIVLMEKSLYVLFTEDDIKKMKIALQDAMNSKCPLIKESL